MTRASSPSPRSTASASTSASPSSSPTTACRSSSATRSIGFSGFIPTDDGTFVAGQPDVAATWYPVNDHPLDKAVLHVPHHRAQGPRGDGQRRARRASAPATARRPGTGTRRTRWRPTSRPRRSASSTCAPTAATGSATGTRSTPTCSSAPSRAPATQYAISQKADSSYKRLARTISVPAGGAQLSFWVNRDTELDWDYMFVEAHAPGSDDWITLPDPNGTRATGRQLLPVRAGSSTRSSPTTMTDNGDGTCDAGRHDRRRGTRRPAPATATSSGPSTCPTTRTATSRSRSLRQRRRRPGRRRLRRRRDRHATARARPRSRTTATRSTAGPSPARPRQPGQRERLDRRHRRRPAAHDGGQYAEAALDRQPEILAFLEGASSGRYPWSASGGIIDDARGPRLRARDPDAARSTRRTSSATRRSRRGRRPRARAPVGGRQPGRRRAGSTSGSTRASRPTRSGCGASARASGPRRRSSTSTRRHPGRRPVLAGRDRRPGRRTSCSTSPSTTAAR